MTTKRTNGMYVLGAAHIVIGAIGLLAGVLCVLACAAALVPQLVSLMGPKLVELASKSHSRLIGLLFLGLVRASIAALLVVAGLNVVGVSPAGRRLSLAAAYAWTVVNVFEAFAFQEPFWLFMASTAYPLLVECLFLQKSWRAIFNAPSMNDVTELAVAGHAPARLRTPAARP